MVDRSPSAPRLPRDFHQHRGRDVSAALMLVTLIVVLAAWKLVEIALVLIAMVTGY